MEKDLNSLEKRVSQLENKLHLNNSKLDLEKRVALLENELHRAQIGQEASWFDKLEKLTLTLIKGIVAVHVFFLILILFFGIMSALSQKP